MEDTSYIYALFLSRFIRESLSELSISDVLLDYDNTLRRVHKDINLTPNQQRALYKIFCDALLDYLCASEKEQEEK